jgi:hypothetical protein
MSFTWLRLPDVWKWGGLSFKELAVRTYEAVDKHENIDRAAIVAFYAMLALVPFLGLVLTVTLGNSDGIAGRGRDQLRHRVRRPSRQVLLPERVSGAAMSETANKRRMSPTAPNREFPAPSSFPKDFRDKRRVLPPRPARRRAVSLNFPAVPVQSWCWVR